MKHFIKALFQDLVDQAWTLLGLGTAWVLLEGSARELVGTMILITLGFWIITFPIFRYEKEEKEPKDGDKDGFVYDGTNKERKAKSE
jgi:putative Mn2+ efflux pump MntP